MEESRSPCGERGLKLHERVRVTAYHYGRSPCGERGLKFSAGEPGLIWNLSLPVRGAWVEISIRHVFIRGWLRRSPCGERGLKYRAADVALHSGSRSPCGERGLKLPGSPAA